MENDLNKNSKKTALVIILKNLLFCGIFCGAIFLWMGEDGQGLSLC